MGMTRRTAGIPLLLVLIAGAGLFAAARVTSTGDGPAPAPTGQEPISPGETSPLSLPEASPETTAQPESVKSRKDIDWNTFLEKFDRPNEIRERRDASSRHYRNADGSVSALITPGPIHYQDERGDWTPIDTVIVESPNGFANTGNVVKSWYPATSDDPRGTKIGVSEDRAYTWTPRSLGYTRADGTYGELWNMAGVPALVDGEEIRYAEIFPNATEQYRVHAGMVKHNLILDSAPALPEASATIDFVGRVELGADMAFSVGGALQSGAFITSGSIQVVTRDGENLFRIGAPLALEENGSARIGGTYAVRPLGENRFEMRIQVPSSWILDEERQYPVKIDPTTWSNTGIKVDNSCHSDEWWVASETFWSSFGDLTTSVYYADGSYGTSYWYDCHVGYDEDWIDETFRSAADWDTSSIPNAADITNTRLEIYVPNTNYGEFDSNGINVRAREMAYNYASRSASQHYSDCANGPIYIDSTYLYKGQGYTGWFDLGTSADAKVKAQLGADWFGIGFAGNQGGDRGVTLWLDFSTLEVTYNMVPTTPAPIAPANGIRTTGNSIAFSWTASTDPDGDPLTYSLYCATAATPTTVIYSGSATGYTWTGAVDATTYYWRVRTYDGASWSNYSTTRSFRENGLPAAPANTTPAADAWLQPATQTVAWTSGGVDPDSDPIMYDWLVATTNPPLSPYVSSGTTSGTTSTPFSTSHGNTYSWMVRAYDGYEYTGWSTLTSFGVDGVTPTAGNVYDGTSADIDWQNSATTVNANWTNFSDALSGIDFYEWAIGTTSGATDLQAWTNVGILQSGTNSSLSLPDTTTVYVSVRATDKAGNVGSVATSDGVTVDITPPAVVAVQDGTAADIDWQNSSTTISANWNASTDAGSGVDFYEWAIGSTSGAIDVQSWTGVGNVTSATNSSLSLADGTVFVSVRVRDKAGNISGPGISDGVTIDATGPTAGTVLDGTGADIDFQSSTTTISANWSGFSDGVGIGIDVYEWAIGMIPGGTSILDWTNIVNVTTVTNSSLSLTDGTYFVSVRAIDQLGNTGGLATSDGVTVDTVAPTTGTVNDGPGADIDWQNDATTIDANWSGFTDAGGISHYEWAIGTLPGGTGFQDWSNAGSGAATTLSAVTLVEGTTYYVSVRAIDNSGKVSDPAVSDGVTIDTTPPDAPVLVAPPGGSLTGPSPLLEWSGSGVSFELYVDGVLSTTPNLSAQPAPQVDGIHYWKVRATDAAGNVSGWSVSWSFLVDATPPTVPILIAPSDGGTVTTSPAIFTWSVPSDANGIDHYDIEISETGVVYQASPTLPQALAPLPDGTFSWRVRASDPFGNASGWSASWTFTMDTGAETNPPTAPDLLLPADTLLTTDPATLLWSASQDDSGIAYYRVQIDTDSGFTVPILLDATTTNLSMTTPSLPTGTYWWRARAVDIYNNVGPWSQTWSFLIDSGTAPPGVPTLLLPPNGFLLPLGTVWLNWTDVAGASSYQVELMLNGTTLSASFVTLSEQTTPALPTGTFAWRVRAIGPGGSGNWTAYHTFSTAAGVTVDPTPPSAPSQYWPLNGATGILDPEVTLGWTPGSDAESGVAYHLVEVFDAGGAPVFSLEVPGVDTTTTPALANGTYTWMVTAVNGAGLSTPATTAWSFTVDTTLDVTPPGAVALIRPLDGAIVGPGPNAFEWLPAQDDGMIAGYEVQIDASADFTTPLEWSLQWNDTLLVLSLETGNHAWRVRAIDGNGNVGPWSDVASFQVSDGAIHFAPILGGGSRGNSCLGSLGGSPLSPELGLLALLLIAVGAMGLRRP